MKSQFQDPLFPLEDEKENFPLSVTQPFLAIQVDQRRWMRFLSEDWLLPEQDGWVKLGYGCVSSTNSAESRIYVTIYIDQNALPNAQVIVFNNNEWGLSYLHQSLPMETIIGWPGPIPMSAVHHVSMDSEKSRAHLMGMVSSFEDLELPSHPILIDKISSTVRVPSSTEFRAPIFSPSNWNALRGAASMAVTTVPSIGPWLNSLCSSLNFHSEDEQTQAPNVPLLVPALWSTRQQWAGTQRGLWQALIEILATPEITDGWMPQHVLEIVCERARELSEVDEVLDRLRDSTMLLLRDHGTIDTLGVKDDFISLAFQLILLRPTPERYMSWREDWRAVPPAAWWTGAMLTGYMRGYKALPKELKGKAHLRKSLAIRTWGLWDPNTIGAWNEQISEKFTWDRLGDDVVISESKQILNQLKMSTRGLWFDLDFENTDNEKIAHDIAIIHCKDAIINTIKLSNGVLTTHGNGKISHQRTTHQLVVDGDIEIEVDSLSKISKKLNVSKFRQWLTHASIQAKLPRPIKTILPGKSNPPPTSISTEFISSELFEIKSATSEDKNKKKISIVAEPNGLQIVPNFLEPNQEKELISIIDSADWDLILKRRVQHYGWRYDYKSRGIRSKDYLGPLPSWALNIAEKLLSDGLVPELPDQVIVNEYLIEQGISKHIDCKECFRGPVTTISLLETWEMIFSRNQMNIEEKYKVMLPRYSAALLSGEARENWTHEIAKKKTDAGKTRVRRVSITFRKVAN
jgi:alkylated DNA repair dioxygenase AlkB